MIWLGVVFIVWLEASEPPSEVCTSENFSAMPEMCDVGFDRGVKPQLRQIDGVVQIYYGDK